jgi:AcrR family transcriptional regulator
MEGSTAKRSSRDAIVAATIQLFSERGYPSTSMRDIANAVGLLPGSLYVHITGKEQLLGDIVENGIDRFIEACQPALDQDESAAARLRSAIKAHMRNVADAAEHMLVALHQWKYLTGERREVVVEKRRQYEAIFTTIINDGIARGEFSDAINPRIAVLTVIGTLNWAAEWFSPSGTESAEQVGDEIADVLLSGLIGVRD